VNLPVEAQQPIQCKTLQLSQNLHARHCCDETVSGLVEVVCVYVSLSMLAVLSNCSVVE